MSLRVQRSNLFIAVFVFTKSFANLDKLSLETNEQLLFIGAISSFPLYLFTLLKKQDKKDAVATGAKNRSFSLTSDR